MAEFINPTLVPKRRLYTGEEIPCIGMVFICLMASL